MESATSTLRAAEAAGARCPGLIGGVARLADLRTPVLASSVRKQHGPFFCQTCLSEAVVKKCSDKDDHFAHKALLSPVAQRGSTAFHHGVRDALCAQLQVQFPRGGWHTEREIKDASGESYRADLVGYLGIRGNPGVPPVAVEIQLSPYSPHYIRKKTAFYERKNIHVLWIVPLTRELEAKAFRPRRYELYLHSLGRGYVWYYEPGAPDMLTPVHYGPAARWIEETSFFGPGGVEERAGGYPLRYKTLKTPAFRKTRQVPIGQLCGRAVPAWPHPDNPRLDVPARKLIILNEKKWWPHEELKACLKEQTELAGIQRYLENYQQDDEFDNYPEEDDY